jgi:hypothetical protein
MASPTPSTTRSGRTFTLGSDGSELPLDVVTRPSAAAIAGEGAPTRLKRKYVRKEIGAQGASSSHPALDVEAASIHPTGVVLQRGVGRGRGRGGTRGGRGGRAKSGRWASRGSNVRQEGGRAARGHMSDSRS